MNFEACAITDKGGRTKNEDSVKHYYMAGSCGCWVVADGLGGHAAGEVASAVAAESIVERFSHFPSLDTESIRECFNYALNRILNIQQEEPRLKSMRTTAVGLFTDCSRLTWAHIGDSRLYFFRDGKLYFQTKDHSVSQACVAAGEITTDQIRFHEDRSKLLKVLGTDEKLKLEIHRPPVIPENGDAFLLCSDGFWEYVLESEMENELLKSENPEIWISRLTELLLGRVEGEYDNFSAIAVFAKQ